LLTDKCAERFESRKREKDRTCEWNKIGKKFSKVGADLQMKGRQEKTDLRLVRGNNAELKKTGAEE